MTRLDMRLAKGRQWDDLDGHPVTDGHSALWVRLPGRNDSAIEMSAAALAILGDYVPFGISQSQGVWWPSNSLDNTIRIVRLVPTEWVLWTSGWTASPTASATARCTCGRTTGRCWPPPASPR